MIMLTQNMIFTHVGIIVLHVGGQNIPPNKNMAEYFQSPVHRKFIKVMVHTLW